MGKHAILIAHIDSADPNNAGIVSKIKGQAKGLLNYGYHVDIIYNSGEHIVFNDSKTIKLSSSHLWNKLNWYRLIKKLISKNYDLYWLRHQVVTADLISFLKTSKNQLHEPKTILDIPTYPYEQEWRGIKGAIALMMDRSYSKKLIRYVDLIAHSGIESQIFGIPTINMTNGIDATAVSPNYPKRSEPLNLIAIAKWQYWHGLDRILKSWQEDPSIHLHIVGDGPCLRELKSIIAKKNLTNISFHGSLIGEPLDQLFSKCHLGIGTLGIHRKGVNINSSLKHREYCARGMPFVYSSSDPDFDQCDFIYQYDPDNSLISQQSMMTFYNALGDHLDFQLIRNYALQHLSWNSKIRHVIDALMNS